MATKRSFKDWLKHMLQLFLQGLIILAPLGITAWIVFSLFDFIDSILPNIIHALFPSAMQNADGSIKRIPGLGFILVIIIVMFAGWLSSTFIVSRLVSLFDKALEKTPGIKFIYTSVKDFLEAFAGNKRKFDKPVMVNVDGEDVWRIGFITQKSLVEFGLQEHVAVYVPHSYAISGITYFVPAHKIKPLNNVSASDAMKFTVSGGVSEVE